MNELTIFVVTNPVVKVFPLALFSTIGRSRRVAVPDSVLSSTNPAALGTSGPFLPFSPGTLNWSYDHRTCTKNMSMRTFQFEAGDLT